MTLREKLQALQESLVALKEEDFLDYLEFLHDIHQEMLITIPLISLEEQQSLQEQDIIALGNFKEILHDLRASLSQLQPLLVKLQLVTLKIYVQNLLQSLEDADSEIDPLKDILVILKVVAPGLRLSILQCLSEMIQKFRPSRGFHVFAITPVLHDLYIFVLLEELAEINLLRPGISQQLNFLDDFVHSQSSPF